MSCYRWYRLYRGCGGGANASAEEAVINAFCRCSFSQRRGGVKQNKKGRSPDTPAAVSVDHGAHEGAENSCSQRHAVRRGLGLGFRVYGLWFRICQRHAAHTQKHAQALAQPHADMTEATTGRGQGVLPNPYHIK